ncbi:hypothetical protein VTN77DRAFT_950 [Rasamsonia byssochlamydoides]|uniref:uncharacterized protein n=1 Tax=Rasamsonia byssochlamydoides TaxID=89139 RepID=UPI003742DCC4
MVDFLSAMLLEGRENVISQEEVASQRQNLIIAGSKTNATMLSSVTYFLMKHPDVYQSFKKEIRDNIESYEDISSSTVGTLPYFNAVSLGASVDDQTGSSLLQEPDHL